MGRRSVYNLGGVLVPRCQLPADLPAPVAVDFPAEPLPLGAGQHRGGEAEHVGVREVPPSERTHRRRRSFASKAETGFEPGVAPGPLPTTGTPRNSPGDGTMVRPR